MSKSTVRAALSGGALMLMAMAAQPASAQDYYAAFAYSLANGAYGYSYNYATQQEAEQRAMEECGKHSNECKGVFWFRNACGALARASDNAYGWAWNVNLGEARVNALTECSKYGPSCEIKESFCVPR